MTTHQTVLLFFVERIAQKNPKVHLLLRKEERGRGRAEIAGFLKALELGADYVLEMDGDFSHHPRYVPSFFEAIRQYDVVIGSRMVPGGTEKGRGFGPAHDHKNCECLYPPYFPE